MKEFKDKVAVITGAASGIGRGLAERCVKEGMKVVLADVEESSLKETEKALKTRGADVLAVKTDVSKFKDIEALAQKTLAKFGAVHLLFNNAGVQTGVQRSKALWENTLADWEWVIGVNLWGVIYGVKVFVPIMLQQKTECHIVNSASIAALMSIGELGIYRVTKSGILIFSETLYLQLKKLNSLIGVTVFLPAFVRSRLNDAERNRPKELKNPPEPPPTPEEQAILKTFEEGNRNAMPPEKFAELVFQAIEEGKLYVFSHPEYNAMLKQRMENMLQGDNPASKY
jgi:NAD(P)-dependent dehydrogenase (short-subunit alcohol dehydrogenase family)